jgi:hypothetical protein
MSSIVTGIRNDRRILPGLCMALALLLLTPAVRPAGGQTVTDYRLKTDRSQKNGLSKEALDAELNLYIKESEAALASRMSELRSFFEERKANTRHFAQSVLGTRGKVEAGATIVGDLLNQFATGFGAARSKPRWLENYVNNTFRDEVLDPAKAKRAVDDAVTGFLGDLAGIEARLLVRLKADIGDGDLDLPGTLRDMRGIGGGQYEAMIRDTVEIAVKDLGVSLGMFVVSNIVSDKLVEKTAPKDMSKGGRFVAGIAAGIAVDAALDKAAREAGYDPEKVLAMKVAAGIDQMSRLLIDGDPEVAKLYPNLSIFRRTHPDQAVRDACKRADEAVMRNGNPGLHERLRRLRNDRYRRLWTVLTGHLFGPEAAKSPFLMYTPLDASKCSPAEVVIRWSKSIITLYGGTRP